MKVPLRLAITISLVSMTCSALAVPIRDDELGAGHFVNHHMHKWSSIINGVNELAQAKSELEDQIINTRQAYWNSFADDNLSDQLVSEYIKILQQKDYYFIYMKLMDSFSNNNNGMQLSQAFDQLSNLFGLAGKGPLDGGVIPYAKREFDSWSRRVIESTIDDLKSEMQHAKKSGAGIELFLGFPSLLAASFERNLSEHSDLWDKFNRKRILGEFYFKNENSPILSEESSVYLPHWLFLTQSIPSLDSARTYTLGLKSMVSADVFDRAVAHMKSLNYPSDLNAQPVYPPRMCLELLDWSLAREDPTLVGPYHIRRSARCTWDEAKQFLQYRYLRHGQEKVDDAIAALHSAIDSTEGKLAGNPLAFNHWNRELTDGLSELLGKYDIWSDYLDYGKQEALRTPELDYYQLTEQSFKPLPYRDAVLIARSIDKDLLTAAIYAQKRLNANNEHFMAQPAFFLKSSPNEDSRTIMMLQGFSLLGSDLRLFCAMLGVNALSENPGQNLLDEIGSYEKLCNKYGTGLVNEKLIELKELAIFEYGKLVVLNPNLIGESTIPKNLKSLLIDRLIEEQNPNRNGIGENLEGWRSRWESYENNPHKIIKTTTGLAIQALTGLGSYSIYRDDLLEVIISNADWDVDVESGLSPTFHSGRRRSTGVFKIVWNVDQETRIEPDDGFRLFLKEFLFPLMSNRDGLYPTQNIYIENWTLDQVELIQKLKKEDDSNGILMSYPFHRAINHLEISVSEDQKSFTLKPTIKGDGWGREGFNSLQRLFLANGYPYLETKEYKESKKRLIEQAEKSRDERGEPGKRSDERAKSFSYE